MIISPPCFTIILAVWTCLCFIHCEASCLPIYLLNPENRKTKKTPKNHTDHKKSNNTVKTNTKPHINKKTHYQQKDTHSNTSTYITHLTNIGKNSCSDFVQRVDLLSLTTLLSSTTANSNTL